MSNTGIDRKDLIVVRGFVPGDKNFIFSTFLRGFYYGNDMIREIPKDVFMHHYHNILDRLMLHPTLIINVACLKEDPDTILGYAISRLVNDKHVLDWVFVKSAWRNIGIAKSLIQLPVHAVTHITKLGKIVKPDDCPFNPFL